MRNTTTAAYACSDHTSTSTRMPMDKTMGADARQTPKLATLAKRPPITPKIASGKFPSSTSNTPQLRQTTTTTTTTTTNANTTTGVRKILRPESTLGNHTTPRDSPADRGAGSKSPVTSFFLSNVTPRSSSRQSRVDSANTSPVIDNGNDTWDVRSGLGISTPTFDADTSRRAAVTFAASPSLGRNQQPGNERDSKFFHASEAKHLQGTSAIVRPQMGSKKASTFFYANGQDALQKGTPKPLPSAVSPQLGVTRLDTVPSDKFVHANGLPDVSLMRPTVAGSAVSSARPSAYRAAPSVQTSSHLAPLSSTNAPVQAAARPTVASPAFTQQPRPLKRANTDAPRATSGSRSGSTGDASYMIRPMYATSVSVSAVPAATPAMTMASILQAAEDLDEIERPDTPEMPASPTKSVANVDPVSELVATARRERKVQDLEITNASLEAINRTLERQLRKQTAELRRYRRLSRGGRLSTAFSATSGRRRVTLGDDDSSLANDTLGVSDDDNSGEEDFEEEEEDDSSESESTNSTNLSPSTIAARDASHRKRDEKRLLLDLSKHQEVLHDSQKMNQSIRRCLNWSEELIKEGKRALEHQVRVSEVEIGGRVLSPDGVEEQYVFGGAADEAWAENEEHAESPTTQSEHETVRLGIERLRLEDTGSEAGSSPLLPDEVVIATKDG